MNVAVILVPSIIAFLSLAINALQFVVSQRKGQRLEQAEASQLVITNPRSGRDILEETVDTVGPGGVFTSTQCPRIEYLAELIVTNRSQRPNSIVSIRLEIGGLTGPFPGVITSHSPDLMQAPHPALGRPLLPPVNISSGVVTERGFVAFGLIMMPSLLPFENADHLTFTILLEDGHGKTYRV